MAEIDWDEALALAEPILDSTAYSDVARSLALWVRDHAPGPSMRDQLAAMVPGTVFTLTMEGGEPNTYVKQYDGKVRWLNLALPQDTQAFDLDEMGNWDIFTLNVRWTPEEGH